VLGVTISADGGADVKPGDKPSYTVTVTNQGTGQATGVSVRVDLPADFTYKSTKMIGGDGDARTQPVDAGINSPTPLWGLWTLAAPGVNADGTPRRSHVDITFVAEAQGKPGDYALAAKASSDASDGLITGTPMPIHVQPSTRLSVTMLALQSSVSPAGTVQYRLIVTNDGSGPASNVGILVSLPPVFQYDTTETMTGNSGRSNPVDPNHGAVVPFYGGFTIPARSDAGAGVLTIVFKATCVPAATGGTYGTTVQVTDGAGALTGLSDGAKVAVNAAFATPVPSATARIGVKPPPA
jgi:uncharacterized repeat protein (TIGR01451 family)